MKSVGLSEQAFDAIQEGFWNNKNVNNFKQSQAVSLLKLLMYQHKHIKAISDALPNLIKPT